jgi:hypothetical protein
VSQEKKGIQLRRSRTTFNREKNSRKSMRLVGTTSCP